MTIVYCGDTSDQTAAAYLCGLMTSWQWPFRYVPSDQPLTADLIGDAPGLFIFSDYPSAMVDRPTQALVADHVRQGAGLLMIGGWESYHGLGGNWDGTPMGDLLPVTISPTDDRVNFDQPTLLRAVSDSPLLHPILSGLPWNERPPTIGGLNKFTPKPGSVLLLAGLSFAVKTAGTHPWIQAAEGFVESWLLPPKVKETLNSLSPLTTSHPGNLVFDLVAGYPVLVIGTAGAGRAAAMATDIAPHWVGGFVDWGETRVTAQAAGGSGIEVGCHYAQFWKQLLTWTGRLGG